MNRRVRVNDVPLAVRQWGNGPPLLLLHGFTGSSASWTAHAEVFHRRFRTVAVDLLGHGETDAPADPARYRMARCIADLAALLDALAIERTALLGYSMGGRVALAFALAHPQRVGALVLEGASPGIADPEERRARIARDERLAERIERDGVETFVDEWMRQPLFATQACLGPDVLAAARAVRLAHRPIGLANSWRGMGAGAQEPLWDRLHALPVPALLLAGEQDTKFLAIAHSMAQSLPDAIVRIVPGAGHATHLEKPAAFRDCVLDFLWSAGDCSRFGVGSAGNAERAAPSPPPAHPKAAASCRTPKETL